MCRLMVYCGPPILMEELVTKPTRSITSQALQCKERTQGSVNGDGFGVGWYDQAFNGIDDEPCLFTSVQPAWNNLNLGRLARKVRSPLIFAHVRAAYPGMPVSEVNCHPFVFGRYMWMHNGSIACFARLRRKLEASLPDELYAMIQGKSDSEAAFALFLAQLPDLRARLSASELQRAMRATVRLLRELVSEAQAAQPSDEDSLLNFVLADGQTIIATRFVDREGSEPATLYFASGSSFSARPDGQRPGGEGGAGGGGGESVEYAMAQDSAQQRAVIVTSEPLSASSYDWLAVPRNSIVTILPDALLRCPPALSPPLRVLIEPLGEHGPGRQLGPAGTETRLAARSPAVGLGERGVRARCGLTRQQQQTLQQLPAAGPQDLSQHLFCNADGGCPAALEEGPRGSGWGAQAAPGQAGGGPGPGESPGEAELGLLMALSGHAPHSVLALAVLQPARGPALLLCGGTDCLVSLWSLRLFRRLGELKGHTRPVQALLAFRCERGSELAVSASADNSIRVWELRQRQCLLVLATRGRVHCLSLVGLPGPGLPQALAQPLLCAGLQDATLRCVPLPLLLAAVDAAREAALALARAGALPAAGPGAGAEGGAGEEGAGGASGMAALRLAAAGLHRGQGEPPLPPLPLLRPSPSYGPTPLPLPPPSADSGSGSGSSSSSGSAASPELGRGCGGGPSPLAAPQPQPQPQGRARERTSRLSPLSEVQPPQPPQPRRPFPASSLPCALASAAQPGTLAGGGLAHSSSPGVGPGASPGLSPGVAPSPSPGLSPGVAPSPSPGLSPGVAPSPSPGLSPGVAPSPSPGLSPGVAPSPSPGLSPGVAPSPSPGLAYRLDSLVACTLRGHAGFLLALCDCAGRWLCSAGGDGALLLWARHSPARPPQLPEAQPEAEAAEAGTAEAAGAEGGCAFWLAHTLRAHSGSALCVAFHRRRSLLLSGGADAVVRLWDCSAASASTPPFALRSLAGHAAAVSAICALERRLLSGDAAGVCRVWDADSLLCLRWLSASQPSPHAGLAAAPQALRLGLPLGLRPQLRSDRADAAGALSRAAAAGLAAECAEQGPARQGPGPEDRAGLPPGPPGWGWGPGGPGGLGGLGGAAIHAIACLPPPEHPAGSEADSEAEAGSEAEGDSEGGGLCPSVRCVFGLGSGGLLLLELPDGQRCEPPEAPEPQAQGWDGAGSQLEQAASASAAALELALAQAAPAPGPAGRPLPLGRTASEGALKPSAGAGSGAAVGCCAVACCTGSAGGAQAAVAVAAVAGVALQPQLGRTQPQPQWPQPAKSLAVLPPASRCPQSSLARMLQALRELVAFRSVSADPAAAQHMLGAALWLRRQLEDLGAEALFLTPERSPRAEGGPGAEGEEGRTQPGAPIVLARIVVDAAKPTLVFYGHYDTVGVSEQGWLSPPFQLTVSDGFVRARGVTDNKGPIVAMLTAVRELLRAREPPPFNFAFALDGEEEVGSLGFERAIAGHTAWLQGPGGTACVLVCNSYWLSDCRPCLVYGLRGVVHLELSVQGGARALHSGVHGGAVFEPTAELASLLATLTEPRSGRVLVEGFERSVRPLAEAEARLYEDVAFDADAYAQRIGAHVRRPAGPGLPGEPARAQPPSPEAAELCAEEGGGRAGRQPREEAEEGRRVLMARWRQPCLSITHLSANAGSASFALIPPSASAHVSVRFVPDQSAAEMVGLLRAHLSAHFLKLGTPNSLVVTELGGGEWWLGDPSGAPYQAAARAVEHVWGVKPCFIREGGTIPVTSCLERLLQAPAVHLSLGQASDNAHLDNERMSLKAFYNGKQTLKRFVAELAKLHPPAPPHAAVALARSSSMPARHLRPAAAQSAVD